MSFKNLLSIPLLLIVMATVCTPCVTVLSSQTTAISILRTRGIEIPTNSLPKIIHVIDTHIDNIKLVPASLDNRYANIILSFTSSIGNGRVEYMAIPGAPMIPYITYSIEIRGRVNEVLVSVSSINFREVKVPKPLMPTPEPIPYLAGADSTLTIRPRDEFYNTSRYLPGRVVSVKTIHAPYGYTVLLVHVYPIQYNPKEGTVIVLNDIQVQLYYHVVKSFQSESNYIVIVTIQDLVSILNDTLAKLYREKFGMTVDIVTVDYIYAYYAPAPNITRYPGFYSPAVLDEVYYRLVKYYNWSLALSIQTYLNETYKQLGEVPFYVVLVGNALDVPPSFYFQYKYTYGYLDPYNSWIPTDLFYADIVGRDLKPELYIGRIPFSDPDVVKKVVSKIIEWYDTPVAQGYRLVMAGGFPFGLSYMFGETALSTLAMEYGYTSTFETIMLTRTSGNYHRESVLSVFAGNYSAVWFFLLAHGSGDSFADQRLGGWETLATVDDILSLEKNPGVPVVTSVACVNGAWDTDLIPPSMSYWTPFSPMSIGQAILISQAGGIAYLGSARIAFEILGPVIIKEGLAFNRFYGATLVHGYLMYAYNYLKMMGETPTLGAVYSEAIAMYSSYYDFFKPIDKEYAEIVLGEVMKLALLGDPVLHLPNTTYTPSYAAYKVEALKPIAYLDAHYAVPYYGEGTVPYYPVFFKGTIAMYGTGSGILNITVFRVYDNYGYLANYFTVTSENVSMKYGEAQYTLSFDEKCGGRILIKIATPHVGELRFYILSFGIRALPDTVVRGGRVTIRGAGLDIFSLYSVDIYFAGRLIATYVRIDPETGALYWEFALPYVAPGVYKVQIIPIGVSLPPDIQPYMSSTIYVYDVKPLDIVMALPTTVQLGSEVNITIVFLVDGQLVDITTLDVKLVTPKGVENVIAIRVSKGVYMLSIIPSTPGIHEVVVTAKFDSVTLKASGYARKSFVVVDNLYNIGSIINSSKSEILKNIHAVSGSLAKLLSNINSTMGETLPEIVENVRILSNKTIIIETILGEIRGTIAEIHNDVLVLNTSIGTILIKLDALENALKDKIEESKEEILGNLSKNIATVTKIVYEQVTSVGAKVDTSTTLNAIMTGLIYVVVLGTTAILIKRRA